MTDNLAPCPFCGGEPKLRTHRSGEDSMECYVECLRCEVRTTYYEDAYAPIDDATGAWNRRTPPPSTHVLPIELNGVSAALDYGKGLWRTCTGCHESNEGYPTGPYSALMKCHLGGGCFECGGIGAVWDTTDYEDMGRYLAETGWEAEEKLTVEEAWTILCETPDITSPEEYPDHALITMEQLGSFMARALPPAPQPREVGE